nr:hypothetical protein [Tanacetum cinerariifolium]
MLIKRAGKGSSATPKNNRARRNALLAGLMYEASSYDRLIKTSIVDLSEHTREPTPPLVVKNSEAKNVDVSDAHSFHFIHEEDKDEEMDDHRYILDRGLRSDLCISSYRASKEMISYLVTPPEDKVLRSLTNNEVVRRTYQSLGQSILSQAKLLRRHEQLDRDYEGELSDRLKDMEREREKWRQTASDQVERIKKLEEDLGPKSKQLSDAENRAQLLEKEKEELIARLARYEADRQSIVRDFIPTVIGRLQTSVDYRRSLAVPINLSCNVGWLDSLSLGRT